MTRAGAMVTTARRIAMYARTGQRTGRKKMVEKEYIPREAAIDALTEQNLVVHMDSVNDGLVASCHRSAQRIIANIPATAVRPVVRGHWTMRSDYLDRLICSKCGSQFDAWHWEAKQMHFCPNCGADMREG